MKKISIFVCVILTMLFNLTCFATTKNDIIHAINKTYYVNGEMFILPEGIRIKSCEYINTHELTTHDCDLLMSYINEAIAFANSLGTVDISKVTKEDIEKGLSIVYKAIDILKKAPEIKVVEKQENIASKPIQKEENKEHSNSIQNSNANTNKESINENIEKPINSNTEIVENIETATPITNKNNIFNENEETITNIENIITFEELESEIKAEILKAVKHKFIEIAIIFVAIIITTILTFFFIRRIIRRRKNTKKI